MDDQIAATRYGIMKNTAADAETIQETGIVRSYTLDIEQRSRFERGIIEQTDPELYEEITELEQAVKQYRKQSGIEVTERDTERLEIDPERMFDTIDRTTLLEKPAEYRLYGDTLKAYDENSTMAIEPWEFFTRYQDAVAIADDPDDLRSLMQQYETDWITLNFETYPRVYEDIFDHVTEQAVDEYILKEARWPMQLAAVEDQAETVHEAVLAKRDAILVDKA